MKHCLLYLSFLLSGLLFLLSSCTKQTDNLSLNNGNISEHSHVVPLDQAIESLNLFLDSLPDSKSSLPSRKFSSVSTIRSNKSVSNSLTRSSSTAVSEALLYLVNFDDAQGYAILAADDRISARILAVTERGNMLESAFGRHDGSSTIANTKSGGFVSSIDSLDFYNNDYDDWYVGEYIGPESSNNVNSLIAELSVSYAENEIRGGIPFKPIIDGEDPHTPFYDDVQTVSYYSDTTYVVQPMMASDSLMYWSQSRTPFVNGLPFPYFHLGCVNLSVARIMAYLQYPQDLYIGGIYINWPLMRNYPTSSGYSAINALYNSFLGSNGTMNISCLTGGTFTLPCSAKNYLIGKGFQNVSYQYYDGSTVRQCLNNDVPVFICSVPADDEGYTISLSHSWILDGYLDLTKVTTNYYYLEGVLIDTYTYYSTEMMVHCDWGWSGDCNGYFYSGLFNLGSTGPIFDGTHSKTTNYNCFLKTITLDHPVL